MTRSLAQRLVIVVCLLALTLGPLLSTFSTAAGKQPSEFHWARKQRQFTVQAVNNVDGGWKKLVNNAIGNWNKSDVVTIKQTSGNHTRSQDCKSTNGKIVVCNWNYGTQDGWLGLTRLFFDDAGEHVDAATVMVNDSYFNQRNGDYNNDNARRHTICHELGHAIGLDHTDTKSCLNHSQYAVFHYTTPINKDFRKLEQIYKHKDSYTTISGKQKAQKKDKKNKKGKKGKKHRKQKRRALRRAKSQSFFSPTSLPAVPSGLEGQETQIVQRLDDGTKMVTYITWADE